ncbi:MAG: alpha/beta hydrolase [Ferruginibacter sp.]
MIPTEEKYINYHNSSIHYTLTGEGLPVVFIHGFAEDSTVWKNQIAFLKNNYKLIIPDLPGSGQSTILKNERIYVEDYAACIKAILDTENIDRCVMIGHSMGGYITLAFAEKFPKSLISFGLFHSSAYADDATKIETRKKAIDFIKNNNAESFLKTSIPGLFFDTKTSENNIEILLKKGNNFTPDALIQYYEAMIARPDRTILLKNSISPVLLIIGQHDKAVPFKLSLEQANMPGHSYIYILRNSAHMGMLEERDRSNKILADFLQIHDLK